MCFEKKKVPCREFYNFLIFMLEFMNIGLKYLIFVVMVIFIAQSSLPVFFNDEKLTLCHHVVGVNVRESDVFCGIVQAIDL